MRPRSGQGRVLLLDCGRGRGEPCRLNRGPMESAREMEGMCLLPEKWCGEGGDGHQLFPLREFLS